MTNRAKYYDGLVLWVAKQRMHTLILNAMLAAMRDIGYPSEFSGPGEWRTQAKIRGNEFERKNDYIRRFTMHMASSTIVMVGLMVEGGAGDVAIMDTVNKLRYLEVS